MLTDADIPLIIMALESAKAAFAHESRRLAKQDMAVLAGIYRAKSIDCGQLLLRIEETRRIEKLMNANDN